MRKLIVIVCALLLSVPSFAAEKKYKTVVREWDEPLYFNGQPPAELHNLSLGFGLGYFDSATFQGRYAYQVIHHGPIPKINNSLYIEGGMGFTLYSNATGINLQLGPRWDFQMTEQWIFFAELALGYNIVTNDRANFVKGANVFLSPGIGAMFNFSQAVAGRVDLSYGFFGAGLLFRF